MSKFVIKNIESVKGKQQFKQLIVLNDIEDADKIQQEIDELQLKNKEVKRKGVLDNYEDNLESKYEKSFEGIIAVMDIVASLETVSPKKFKDVTPPKEKIKEYEFKFGDLRVYAIKIRNGQLVLLGGYKNHQKQDFSKFRSLKKRYMEYLKNKENEKR